MRPLHIWQSGDIAMHTDSKATAAERLMMLRLPAMLGLMTAHLQIRAIKEPLDPVALTETAHKLLAMASDAERAQIRRERNAA